MHRVDEHLKQDLTSGCTPMSTSSACTSIERRKNRRLVYVRPYILNLADALPSYICFLISGKFPVEIVSGKRLNDFYSVFYGTT
jgi:hypothetical protein